MELDDTCAVKAKIYANKTEIKEDKKLEKFIK